MNSLGDSHSQNEDKLKANHHYIYQAAYDQQQQYSAYMGQPFGIQKKEDMMAQGAYFQNYPSPYVVGQQQTLLSGAHLASQIQTQASLANLKEKEDPSKKQPNSPGRKKTIKKGSPTTEPSSPASPKLRNKKSTQNKPGGSNFQKQPQQPESSSTLNPTLLQSSQTFGLHLMKVPNQDPTQKPLTYPGGYPQLSNQMQHGQIGGGLHLDQKILQITGIDPAQLQRFHDLPNDFNMNDLALFDDQKNIGTLSREERNLKIKRFQEKRRLRSFTKKISYDVRKKVADSRLRVKGRFVTKEQAMQMLNLPGKGEELTMDDLKEMLKQRGFQPTGGDDDSKSPTLVSRNNKKHQSMPGTVQSLKQGDEDEDEEVKDNLDDGKELPKKTGVSKGILRGKSCEDIVVKQADCFNSNRNIEHQSDGIQASHNFQNQQIHNSTNHGGQLLLKLEQKDNEIKHQSMNGQPTQILHSVNGQNYLMNQGQPQLAYNNSQTSSSQSPSRSPKKQGNLTHQSSLNINDQTNNQQQANEIQGGIHQQVNRQSSLTLQPSLQSIQSEQGDSQQNGYVSSSNILSSEIADRFGNLNIKSPDQKHQVFISQSNPSLLNLTDISTGLPVQQQQQFFGNPQHALLQQNQLQPQNQNYGMYVQQQQLNGNSNSSNQGYAIDQHQ